jgi:hypothetical protein
MLARSFDHVLASDPAPSAIAVAAEKQIEGVRFEVGDASSCSLSDHAVDLIAASQAAHWFDMDAFAIEARRVGADGALVAFWCYDRPRVTAEVDAAVDHLYFDVLRGCWDSGRSHIDSRYADLPFPFDEIQLEIPAYEARWTADAMLGYLRTWSGVDALAERGGGDGVAIIEASVREAWGTGTRPVRWPTAIRAGLVSQ